MMHFFSKVKSKYFLVTSDFKTVEKKFADQGVSLEVVKDYLEKFKTLRDRNQLQGDDRDIDSWGKKSWEEFKEFMDTNSQNTSKTAQKKLARTEGAKQVFEDDNWVVYHITSYEASKLYGSGTKWCISARDDMSNWKRYNRDSHFYFLISKTRDSRDPFYKVALEVSTAGKAQAWNATDKHYSVNYIEDDPVIGGDVLLPKFEWQTPKTGVLNAKGERKDLLEFIEEVTRNPQSTKETLLQHGVIEWVGDDAVLQVWDNLAQYAKLESSDLKRLIGSIDDGDLVSFDQVDRSEMLDFFDDVSGKKEMENVFKKFTKDDLENFAQEYDRDLDEVKTEFASDPAAVVRDMLSQEFSAEAVQELETALYQSIHDGWQAGTEGNAWANIKYFFTDTPHDHCFFIIEEEGYWADNKIKLALPFKTILPFVPEIMEDDKEVYEVMVRHDEPVFKWPRFETEFDRDYAIDSFFQQI